MIPGPRTKSGSMLVDKSEPRLTKPSITSWKIRNVIY